MPDDPPIGYTGFNQPRTDDDHLLTGVQLPADIADALALTTAWLSAQLKHRVPLEAVRRALLLGGVAHPRRALAELQTAAEVPPSLS